MFNFTRHISLQKRKGREKTYLKETNNISRKDKLTHTDKKKLYFQRNKFNIFVRLNKQK